jgi:hypothetical protein
LLLDSRAVRHDLDTTRRSPGCFGATLQSRERPWLENEYTKRLDDDMVDGSASRAEYCQFTRRSSPPGRYGSNADCLVLV